MTAEALEEMAQEMAAVIVGPSLFSWIAKEQGEVRRGTPLDARRSVEVVRVIQGEA